MGEEIIKFLNSSRSLLIAPAGYGKTTLLAECISYLLPLINKPILVLTHTHAGVASIKKKCSSIKSGRFLEITTISGFAQRIVTTYSGHLPGSQKDGKPDFPKINHLARLILRRVHLWNKNEINLNALPIMYYKAESTDEDFWPRLSKFISNLQSHNLLVIFPNGFEYQIDTRAQKRTQFDFAREFSLIEAIDDKAFYSCASRIDRYVLNPNKPVNLDMLINLSFASM